MSYSANLKREIFNLENSDKDAVYAELFGILIAKNVITENGIYFSTENVSLAKRIYSNLRTVTNIPIQLKYVISKRLGIHKLYEVILFPTQHNQQEYKLFLKNFLYILLYHTFCLFVLIFEIYFFHCKSILKINLNFWIIF